ncbi:MAG: pyridoxal-phosphate dependent enzyme [Chloroflexia bacterium]
MPTPSVLSLDNIAEAATTIDPVFLNSPQFIAEGLSRQLGLRLLCKVEVVNPIRSFKGRGTDYFAQSLGDDRTPLVCASAGNFGQGLAFAARKREHPAPRLRRRNRQCAQSRQDAQLRRDRPPPRRRFRRRQGGRERLRRQPGPAPGGGRREIAIAEGAGTMAVELARWPEPLDAVYVPVGNGALINGVGRWLKHVSPHTRLIGIGATGSPSMERSWRTGTIVLTDTADTIADGIATRVPIPMALNEMALAVDDMVLVDDDAIRDAMKPLYDELGVVIEPSAAAGLAAIIAHREQLQGQLVATIICGGNALPEHVKWEVGS